MEEKEVVSRLIAKIEDSGPGACIEPRTGHAYGRKHHLGQPGGKAYRVLVVDDKEENRKVVVNFLRLVGFETLEAVNGLEAIAKFEQGNPHLILLDIIMPGIDGYEVCRQLKENPGLKDVPVTFISAQGDTGNAV